MDSKGTRSARLKKQKEKLARQLEYSKMEKDNIQSDRARFFMTGDKTYLENKTTQGREAGISQGS